MLRFIIDTIVFGYLCTFLLGTVYLGYLIVRDWRKRK